jgi:phage terminase large subunit GpA-like protein
MLIVGLDCQDDYVDGVVVGFGRNLSRQVIARVRIEGHISTPETRAELNRLVEFEWPTAYGSRRKADLCGIDANAWTDDVFDWAKHFPKSRVIMVRGVKGDRRRPLLWCDGNVEPMAASSSTRARFFNVGVNSIKGALYKFLRVEKYDHRGFIDFPAGFDDDYYEQLTAEKRTAIVDRAGFTVYAWIKPRGQRNEQLDCMVYAQAMATKLGWRIMTDEHWDQTGENRELPAEVRSSEHAANEFWNRDSMPSVASPDLLPQPPPSKSRRSRRAPHCSQQFRYEALVMQARIRSRDTRATRPFTQRNITRCPRRSRPASPASPSRGGPPSTRAPRT